LPGIRIVNPLRIITYGAVMTALYYDTARWLLSAWSRKDFSYGYLIPFVLFYLLWEKKKALSEKDSKTTWEGIFPLAIGIFLFLIGKLASEPFVLCVSCWMILVGLLCMHMGWEKLKVIAFPVLFSLTMFPPPNFIVQSVSIKLKVISSLLAVHVMRLFGMSVYREGNIIDMGFTQLKVVDSCSGLQYLLALVVLSILLAYFYKSAWWKRLLLVISAIPISVVFNGFRIASIGMLCQFWGPVSVKGFSHDFLGLMVFMFCVGIMVLEMLFLKKVGSRSSRRGEETATAR
jgi:exosortase D (VPLPA-CTERM-specific)